MIQLSCQSTAAWHSRQKQLKILQNTSTKSHPRPSGKILRRIFEVVRDQNLLFVSTFVDFRKAFDNSLTLGKAFDNILRPVMFRIPRSYGVWDNVCKEIYFLYCGTKSSVLVDGKMSREF